MSAQSELLILRELYHIFIRCVFTVQVENTRFLLIQGSQLSNVVFDPFPFEVVSVLVCV